MSKVDSMISAAHLSPIEKMGKRLESTFTAEQAMKDGGLADWDVRTVPAFAIVDGKRIRKEGMAEVVRTHPETQKPDVLSRHSVSEKFHVVQNEARGEIRHDRALPMSQNDTGSEGQRVILAHRFPVLGDESQPIHVRIHCQTDVGPSLKHEPFQLMQVFGYWFRRTRKTAIGLQMDRRGPATELIQERRDDQSASSADAVERHVEATLSNPAHIHIRERQNLSNVPGDRITVLVDDAESFP